MKVKLLFVLVFFCGALTFAQKTVTGTVTGKSDGEPLPGVSVTIKGTTTGTETDFDGKYTIKIEEGKVLLFSYLGFKSLEKTVGSNSVIDVVLEEENSVLDEIVIVGYGKTSKVDLTGSVVKLKPEEINNPVVPSIEQVFQGNAPGVFVESQSAKLGGAIRINIRGVATINGGAAPLYVVDGIVISATDFGAGTGGTSTNALNSLNPADIESIEILKDAASTAIYGSRGANGVVLITTKKGKEGVVKVSLSLTSGFAEPTRLRSFAGAEDYARITGPLFDGYFGAGVGDQVLDHLSNGTDWRNNEVDTDWQSLAFQDAFFSTASLSLSGGNEKTKFYASLSRNDKDGIYIGTKQGRSVANFTIDSKYKEVANFGFQMNYSRTKTDQVSGDNAFSTPIQLVAQAPISPVFDASGSAIDYTLGFGTGYYNTIVELENSFYFTVVDNLLLSGYANFNITEDLALNSQLGINKINFRQENFQNALTQDARADNGSNLQYLQEQTVVTPQVFLTFNKTFSEVHDIDATVGFETRFEKNLFSQIRGIGFDTPGLNNIQNASAIDRELTSSSVGENFFSSVFGRLNYKLQNKYLFGFSARWDSSSRFGANNRTGFFPSVSAGWKLSEEDFLKDNDFINFLKLRTSFGLTGNSNIANFRDRTLFSTGVYRGGTTYFVSQLGDPNLSWETTEQFDIGLEFQLFDRKLSGEISYYNKQTDDLFFNNPISPTAGDNSIFTNIGAISNKGIELTLNATAIEKEDFSWNVSMNFARNRNKVESLPSGDILPAGSRFMNSVIVGQPLGVFYGIEFAGVDPATGFAEYFAADGTRTDAANAEQKVIGDPNPDWIGAITNTFRYKNFDLSFMFQTVMGNDIHLGGDSFMVGGWFDNILSSALDAWTAPGDITNTPRFDDAHVSQSTRFLSDGSYVRLKNLTLGFNFGDGLLNKLKLDNMRVFFTGYNLLTFTNYAGWDPEVNADYRSSNINIGSDFYSGPQEKSYSLGLLIGL